jgi:hypothetical protein
MDVVFGYLKLVTHDDFGGAQPCHGEVLNLDRIVNRRMANAPIANAPTATAPTAVAITATPRRPRAPERWSPTVESPLMYEQYPT